MNPRKKGFSTEAKFFIVFLVFGGIAFVGYQLYTFASTKQGVTLRTIFSVDEYNPLTFRSLVGHWTFDGDAITLGARNTVRDISGAPNVDGTLVYGTTTGAGRIGQAVDFDGVDDFIYIDGSGAINNMAIDSSEGASFAVWIKPDTDGLGDGTYGGLIMTKGAADGWWLSMSESPANAIRWTRGCGASTLFRTSAANTIKNGEWNHVVVTTTGDLTASTVKIYVNGVETSYFEGINCSGSYDPDTEADLLIGGNVATNLFDGKIDDVRLYRKILSQKEITDLYKIGATSEVNNSLNTVTSLQDGLQGYWTLDGKSIDLSQNTAEIIDDSGGGNTGDWVNHSSTTVTGRVGQALSFSGTTNYIDFTNTTNYLRNVSSATLAAWVKPTVAAGLERIAVDVSVGTSNNTRLSFAVTGTGGVSVVARAGDAETANIVDTVANPLADGGWHHVVVTTDYAGDNITVYVDGVNYPTATSPAFTASATSDTSPNNVAIASDASLGATGRYVGSIDDVRIYGRSLSEKEAVDLYQLGATSKIGISQQAEPSLSSGLVAYWPFDGKYIDLSQNTGEVLDASGAGLTGDWLRHASTTGVGRIGQALSFDGVDDVVSFGASTNLLRNVSQASIALWMYTPAGSLNDRMVTVSNGSSGGSSRFGILVNGGGLVSSQFRSLDADALQTVISVNTLDTGKWHHIAVTVDYSTATVVMYIDGVPVSTTGTPAFGSSSTSDTSPAEVSIGMHGNLTSEPLQGKVDDLRIYNRVLSQKEVTQLYQYGK